MAYQFRATDMQPVKRQLKRVRAKGVRTRTRDHSEQPPGSGYVPDIVEYEPSFLKSYGVIKGATFLMLGSALLAWLVSKVFDTMLNFSEAKLELLIILGIPALIGVTLLLGHPLSGWRTHQQLKEIYQEPERLSYEETFM